MSYEEVAMSGIRTIAALVLSAAIVACWPMTARCADEAASAHADTSATAPPFQETAMDVSALAAQRGGFGLAISTNVGYLYGDSATNTVSAANTIANGAFANVNGLATVVQNSGNNVLIQNSTSVTVELK